jgi:hypothetical protein
VEKIRRSERAGDGTHKAEIDIEVLLKGAEKLSNI